MLKKTVKYESFDGEEVEEIFYFNISEPELLEIETKYEGGFGGFMQRIIEAQNLKSLLAEFKFLVLMAYGERSLDGKRFVKNDEIRENFSQTAAYPVIFMELATSDDAAIAFLKGALPKSISSELDKQAALKPPTPPAV